MLTNLLATVTVLICTNISTRWPMHAVPSTQMVGTDGIVYTVDCWHEEPDANPTWKDETTEIWRLTQYEIPGVGTLATSNRLSSVTRHFELHTDWQETPAPTNGCQWLDGYFTVTNAIFRMPPGYRGL